ncbi:MAG TPA: ATP-binding protein [Syntrophales bacterium]|nr:ATP-binding protein [Syntrophales bacterium]
MNSRLFLKIFGCCFTVAALAVLVAAVFLSRQMSADVARRTRVDMKAQGQTLALLGRDTIATQISSIAKRTDLRITLIDLSGNVTADSDDDLAGLDNHLNRPEIQQARLRGLGESIRYSRSLKKDMLYVALPIEGAYLRLAKPLGEMDEEVRSLHRFVFRLSAIVLLFSLALAAYFSWSLVRPIRAAKRYLEQVRSGERPNPPSARATDEIGELVEHINGVVNELYGRMRAAQEERQKLEAVFSGMAEGIVVLDENHRIEIMNRRMEEMLLDRRPSEVQGRTLLEIFHSSALQDAFRRLQDRREPVTAEFTLERDPPLILEARMIPLAGTEAGGKRTVIVFQDLSHIKKLERMRIDFVANVTHEIRTPLTAIIGFVETLQSGAVANEETARKFLSTIQDNAQRLNRLVEDLLTLSRFELREGTLHLENLFLAEVLDKVLAVVGAKAGEKDIKVVKEIPEATPPILADRDRFAQILLNILDNAVKFTPNGGRVTVAASSEEPGFLTIRISDTGIGIPKGELPRLGERFYRVDKARSRELGGTGLGLSIVKHLMRAHQGRMDIDSVLGHGTTVSLRFPVAKETR